MADPPTMLVAGFTKKCTECHSLFTSDPDTPLRLNQHRNIVQAHGTKDGDVLALDAKMNFDDNALFRHKDVAGMRDEDAETL